MSGNPGALVFRAGSRAAATIRREGGLDPARIRLMIGASGGPKWLVLARLDRAIAETWLAGRTAPLDLVGSSIGTWRFACHAQADPQAAFDRFEAAYLDYRYVAGQTPAEIGAESRKTLDAMLGGHGAAEILAGPMRLHVMAVRGRHLLGGEGRLPLGAGLAAAALGNLVTRRALGGFFERALFADPRSTLDFARFPGFPFRRIALDSGNLADAIMASSSIPFVLEGVRDIAGAPPGLYRDGGIIDYHFDLPVLDDDPEGIALQPHFLDRVIPGWFDKPLRRRHRLSPRDAVLRIAPSEDFVAALPFGKIPDRKDFLRLDDAERLRYWRRVLAETERLADDFRETVERGLLPDRLAAD